MSVEILVESVHLYMTGYRGAVKKSLWHRLVDWFAYTVVMGLIPLIIRAVILWLIDMEDMKFELSDCRTELFFLTIVLLVDAIRNYKKKSFGHIMSVITLVFCAAIYGFVLGADLRMDLDKFIIPISSDNSVIATYIFLAAGGLLDFVSVLVGGANDE